MKDAERIAELEAALRRSELLIEQLQAQLNLRRRKRERLAGCSADKLAALSPAEQPAPVVPEVAGIGRDADHSRAVVLYLRKEPNDDDIRAIQEALRVARKTYMALAALSTAEQPGPVVPEEWRAGVLAVATMVEKKADNYAAEFGSVDMGALSFGIGHRADIKRDHYHSLVELADEIRALLASAQPQGGEA